MAQPARPSARPIRTLLIANRGEIAVRVIRAAREMGIRTVAVYSEADRDSIHAGLADEAVAIGESEPAASYLDVAKILEAATATGADAIHPGYGFLSERPEFSEACAEAGIVFVGPSAESMRKLGSKIEAKQLAVAVGVPVTPGFFEPNASPSALREAADRIGYPIMLKASAGGGGRGMRIVREPASFDQELSMASDEALKAFGNGEMMVEKLIERPRHIEVQAIADLHGNAACLFERECSIQRRHQKLIEEAPSAWRPLGAEDATASWPNLRSAALRLIEASRYTGAGTVEFMVDPESRAFYFLEVNTRLQVEHPVTEAITGLDLVQWQIRIASGEKLELQKSLLEGDRRAVNGHAIEARIIAEDPAENFMPSIGKILAWAEPRSPGVRVDTGFAAGGEISRFYDSLIAKVIAHGQTRAEAIARLESALLDFHVLGIKTNIGFLLEVIRHPLYAEGEFDTGFLAREIGNWTGDGPPPEELAAIVLHAPTSLQATATASTPRVWDLNDDFRIVGRG